MRKDEKSISEYRSCPLKSEHFTISLHMDLGYTSSEIMSNPNVSFCAPDSTWPSTPKSHKKRCFLACLYTIFEKKLLNSFQLPSSSSWSSSSSSHGHPPSSPSRLALMVSSFLLGLDQGTSTEAPCFSPHFTPPKMDECPFKKDLFQEEMNLNISEPIVFQGIC